MKVRSGFVSNSSSSSFCIMGIRLETKDWDEAEKLTEGTTLIMEPACDANDDTKYIGLPHSLMKGEETLKEFRNRVLEKVQVNCPEVTEVYWIVDGGYNG